MTEKLKFKQIGDQKWKELVEKRIEAWENQSNSQWNLGDVICEVDIIYGEKNLEKFADDIKIDYHYLMGVRQVSKLFKKSERSDNLSWSHHYVVCRTDNPMQWIKRADENGWSVRELQEEIKKLMPAEEPIETILDRFEEIFITKPNEIINEFSKYTEKELKNLPQSKLQNLMETELKFSVDLMLSKLRLYKKLGLNEDYFEEFQKKCENISGDKVSFQGALKLFEEIRKNVNK